MKTGLTTCTLDLTWAPIRRTIADRGAKVRLGSEDIWAEELSEGPTDPASRGPGGPVPAPPTGRPGPVGPTALAKCNFPSVESRKITVSGKKEGPAWLKGLIAGGARSRASCRPRLAPTAIAQREVAPQPTDLASY